MDLSWQEKLILAGLKDQTDFISARKLSEHLGLTGSEKGIRHAAVYAICRGLIRKGFVERDTRGNFAANPAAKTLSVRPGEIASNRPSLVARKRPGGLRKRRRGRGAATI